MNSAMEEPEEPLQEPLILTESHSEFQANEECFRLACPSPPSIRPTSTNQPSRYHPLSNFLPPIPHYQLRTRVTPVGICSEGLDFSETVVSSAHRVTSELASFLIMTHNDRPQEGLGVLAASRRGTKQDGLGF